MKKFEGKAVNFFRRNAVYFVLGLCVLAIGFSVALALTERKEDDVLRSNIIETINEDNKDTDNKEDTPQVTTPTYILPVENIDRISSYSDTVVFNSTLNRYSSHLAVDFFGNEGDLVFAISDGTVESVETTFLTGTTVVINHGNGLKSIYNSLLDGDSVVVGQSIKQGDVIGEMSSTNRQEYKEGAHLHFSMEQNGKIINPTEYLTFNEK